MTSKKNKKAIYNFFYQKQNELYDPIAIIEIESFNKKIKNEFTAIIDTGSQITLIATEILKEFNFPSTSSNRRIEFAGTGSKLQSEDTVVYFCRIRFKHDTTQEIKYQTFKVYSCSRQFLRQDIILGMDFLKHFEVCFLGEKEELSITYRYDR